MPKLDTLWSQWIIEGMGKQRAVDADGLTVQQAAFRDEYMLDLNSTQAAIRAGYSPKTAGIQGSRLLTNPNMRTAINRLKAERKQATGICAERVLVELATSAFLDPISLFDRDGCLLPLADMPEAARRTIAGIEVVELFDGVGEEKHRIGYLKKIKIVSKEGTLNLIGKHLKMFSDVDINLNISVGQASRLDKATKAADAK
jgi:phage terminase small subunit